MTNQEFTIEGRSETFRIGKVSPVDLLAFGKSALSEKKDEIVQQGTLINFALEHTEVKIGETWLPVKTPGRDIWWPQGIESDLNSLAKIDGKFESLVFEAFFPKSSK